MECMKFGFSVLFSLAIIYSVESDANSTQTMIASTQTQSVNLVNVSDKHSQPVVTTKIPSINNQSTKKVAENRIDQRENEPGESIPQHFHFNAGATLRAFYVTLGISSLIVVYFLIRAIRLRRKSKLRKYGIIARKEDMEMAPLDQEDEEEDNTVFDAQDLRK